MERHITQMYELVSPIFDSHGSNLDPVDPVVPSMCFVSLFLVEDEREIREKTFARSKQRPHQQENVGKQNLK
eukprot:scaffold2347_cov287-Chaetoceros_neogracile.AAC.7